MVGLKGLLTWINKLSGWIKAVVGFITFLIASILLIRGNFNLFLVVFIACLLIALLTTSLYVLFASRPSHTHPHHRTPRYPKKIRRLLAIIGVVVTLILMLGVLFYPSTRSYVVAAFMGTPTPTATLIPSLTPTPTASAIPTSTATWTSTPTITPTSTPSPTSTPPLVLDPCTSNGQITFIETFDDNNRGWQTADTNIAYPYTEEERIVTDGFYRLSIRFMDYAFTTSKVPIVSPKDLFIQVQAKITDISDQQGDAYIVITFRENYNDPNDLYYVANFSNDGRYSLWKKQLVPTPEPDTPRQSPFAVVIPWTESNAFDLSVGKLNTFSVRADGWSITLCANGTRIGSVIDSSINSNGITGIGLGGGNKDLSVIVTFDNVVIGKIR